MDMYFLYVCGKLVGYAERCGVRAGRKASRPVPYIFPPTLRLRARRAYGLDLRAREVWCGGFGGCAGRKASRPALYIFPPTLRLRARRAYGLDLRAREVAREGIYRGQGGMLFCHLLCW